MTLDKLLKLSETEPQFPHVPWEGADSQKPLHNGPSSPPGRPLLSSPSFSLLPSLTILCPCCVRAPAVCTVVPWQLSAQRHRQTPSKCLGHSRHCELTYLLRRLNASPFPFLTTERGEMQLLLFFNSMIPCIENLKTRKSYSAL